MRYNSCCDAVIPVLLWLFWLYCVYFVCAGETLGLFKLNYYYCVEAVMAMELY